MRANLFTAWLISAKEKKDTSVPTTTVSVTDIVYCSLLSLICTSIFCLNITVITLYILKKNLQKKAPNFMLCHLSIIGTFNGITFNVVLLIHYNNLFHIVHPTGMRLLQLLGLYTVNLTVTSLLFMALERYIAITKPEFYRSLLSRCSMLVFAITLWILPALTLALYLIGDFHIVVFTFIVLFECIAIVLLLYRSFIIVRDIIKEKVEEAKRARNLNSIYFIKQNQKRDRRFVKILIGMVVMFILLFLPWATVSLIYNFFQSIRRNSTFTMLANYSVVLYLCNALVNPILTLTLKDDYRNVFTKFWQRSKSRRIENERKTPSIISTTVWKCNSCMHNSSVIIERSLVDNHWTIPCR